jgi:hypothetical protein
MEGSFGWSEVADASDVETWLWEMYLEAAAQREPWRLAMLRVMEHYREVRMEMKGARARY